MHEEGAGQAKERPTLLTSTGSEPSAKSSQAELRAQQLPWRTVVRLRRPGRPQRLTFFTRRQTWWPWMERLYMEAQESTRSTTATEGSVRPDQPQAVGEPRVWEEAKQSISYVQSYQKNGDENRSLPGGYGRTY